MKKVLLFLFLLAFVVCGVAPDVIQVFPSGQMAYDHLPYAARQALSPEASAAGIDAQAVGMSHLDGTDSSTTITGSELTPKTWTAAGNVHIVTAQGKFAQSAVFDGSGDCINTADSADWDIGTASYTIDFWVKFNTVQSNQYFFELGSYSESTGIELQLFNSALRLIAPDGATLILGGTWAPSTGTWYHVAVVRNGTAMALYVDGTSIATGTDSTSIPGGTTGFHMGAVHTNNTGIDGWLDEFRISNGIARWTANFTPPTAAYSVVSGPTNVKTYNGLAAASVKTINGLAIASVKTDNGTS